MAAAVTLAGLAALVATSACAADRAPPPVEARVMVTEPSACWDIAAAPFWPPSGHHALALLPSSSTTGSAVCRRDTGVAGAAAATTTAADEAGMAAMEPPGVE